MLSYSPLGTISVIKQWMFAAAALQNMLLCCLLYREINLANGHLGSSFLRPIFRHAGKPQKKNILIILNHSTWWKSFYVAHYVFLVWYGNAANEFDNVVQRINTVKHMRKINFAKGTTWEPKQSSLQHKKCARWDFVLIYRRIVQNLGRAFL